MDKYLTRKNIFIVLGVIIALEVIWAGWSLLKPQPTPTTPAESMIQQTSLTLSTPKLDFSVGEEIEVSIQISSSKNVDGADLIISFDPKILTAKPTALGTIFSDYPQNTTDAILGKMSISGITSQMGGVVLNGEFGKLNFVAKAAGTTRISFDFTPGQTVDTNIIESGTGKDILEKVNQLEINILP